MNDAENPTPKAIGSIFDDGENKSPAETAQDTFDPHTGSGWSADLSDTLVQCVAYVLQHHGENYSLGAVRDLPRTVSAEFDPGAAILALEAAGFDASFGAIKHSELGSEFCPAIAFTREGNAVILMVEEDTDSLHVMTSGPEGNWISQRFDEIAETISEFFIILRKRDPNAKSPRQNDWFWGSFSQNKWLYAQVATAAALTNFLGLSTSLFIMVVYDRVVPNEAIESLIALTIGVAIALSFDFLIKTLRAQFVDTAGRRADGRMTRLIFDKILSMPPDKKRQNAGSMASIVREFDTLREFFTSATLVAVIDLPFVFFFIWIISLIAGPLALVPLIAVPLVIASGLLIQPFLARISDSAMKTGMSKQGVLIETLNGLETVQATGSGRLMRKRFEEAADTQSQLGLKSRMLSQFAINSTASIQQFAQIATIFYGVFLIQDGVITMGALIAAVILGGRTLSPLSQLAAAMSRANSAKSAFKSLSSVMNSETPQATQTSRLSRPQLRGEIEFRGVSYSFPGANSPVVKDLSFKILPGQKVAVMGKMGSGKSTLLRLLAGLIEPTNGAILLDGVDIRQIDRSDLRRNVGVMLQEAWLFSGTIKENIQMGFSEYKDHHILETSKIAGVDDFVSTHPHGYDMMLREKGEGLSGGQRQSINLARALLHSPNTLLLDEPTSAMDTATEKSVIQNLAAWGEGRTIVMVTHRRSLLDIADRVFVFDRGSIAADTSPTNLRQQRNKAE